METAARQRRADVAASYDLGVDGYEQMWSPVILPAATALVGHLELPAGAVVIDMGGGSGALAAAVRAAARGASVVVVDASREMLRVAHQSRGVPAVQGDAAALPVADRSADVVVAAYVLFHLADPLAGLREAARVLRPGGRVGTVTWQSERGERAQTVWNDALNDAEVPPLPARRVDTDLDNQVGLRRLFEAAGLVVDAVWTERLQRQWDAESFWARATGSGVNRQRLAHIDPDRRRRLLADVRGQLDELGPEAFGWEGTVLCATSTKAARRPR